MYRDRDFDLEQNCPWNEEALIQDLELNTLFNAMAQGDQFLFDVAKRRDLFGQLTMDLDTILYRQDILKDCLNNPAIVREHVRPRGGGHRGRAQGLLGSSAAIPARSWTARSKSWRCLWACSRGLRGIADEQASHFESEGFTTLFAMLQEELSDDYFAIVKNHLRQLQFPRRGA